MDIYDEVKPAKFDEKTICTFMVGIPGCGKSTYAKSLGLPVVSTDEIREEINGDVENQNNGALVFDLAYERVADFLAHGKDCIFDATNVVAKYRDMAIAEIEKKLSNYNLNKVSFGNNVQDNQEEYDYVDMVSFNAIVFTTAFNTCIDRQKQRGRLVPIKVCSNMQKSLERDIDKFSLFDDVKYIDNTND
jgi:predicted kinase